MGAAGNRQMAAAAVAPNEAPEREDPMNALLEAFEGTVRALIDNGLEPQLRARLARLLPPEAVPAAGDLELKLRLVNLDCLLLRWQQRTRSPEDQRAIGEHRALVAELARRCGGKEAA
mgnify:CR=1 FL=1